MINYYGILAIYNFEMARAIRTIGQTVASPVISTALYFVVFGSAIGIRIGDIDNNTLRSFHCSGTNNVSCIGTKYC